eukprot:TRINITY_DN3606_c0_g1_i1.p1 TRINITY_DN3606_c0_g1~~TRINITY_DN3606_c0_g1_i1.p1  ORF type:complete len:443 (+),score=45.19 TRINITY_DN3606_c0_g1_i1:436-1764(+)
MCFIAKCPYVPPHSFNIDFPQLMLRHRAVANKKENKEVGKHIAGGVTTSHPQNVGDKTEFTDVAEEGISRKLELTATTFIEAKLNDIDFISSVASPLSPMTNTALNAAFPRKLMERMLGIHRKAELPQYAPKTLVQQAEANTKTQKLNTDAPAYGSGRKVVLYATCYGNWNKPDIGLAAISVLQHNGVEVKTVYPGCCGMPQFEQGRIAAVSGKAKQVARVLQKWVEQGYTVVSLVPSCSLMLKSEWKSILPGDEAVQLVSANTMDISEYIMDLHTKHGLVPISPQSVTSHSNNSNNTTSSSPSEVNSAPASVSLHNACHSRAQNIGFKAKEMLQLIPGLQVAEIENCAGHGGVWGVRTEHFDTALKVGKKVFRQVAKNMDSSSASSSAGSSASSSTHVVASECPLAAVHIKQGVALLTGKVDAPNLHDMHPIELLAQAYHL